ncbi:reverse transcriptase [Colletotrichum tofieldiae]|nr:reverse transcriptase [Colletotrichum tofieldiae]
MHSHPDAHKIQVQDVEPSITVYGLRGRQYISTVWTSPETTAKSRLAEQVKYQDNIELKDEINKLANLVQDLLRRNAEREQFLEDCLKKIESLEKELQEGKQRSGRHQRGLARSMHAIGTCPSETAQSLPGHSLHTAQNQLPPALSYAAAASQPPTRKQDELTPAKQTARQAAKQVAKQIAKQAALNDLRVFARLPPDSPLRKEKAYDINAFVREKLSPQAREALKGIDHVKTGLALLPSSVSGAKLLLDNKEQIAGLLQVEAIEQRDTWIRAYIANVPYTRHCLVSNIELEITPEELFEEIQLACFSKKTKSSLFQGGSRKATTKAPPFDGGQRFCEPAVSEGEEVSPMPPLRRLSQRTNVYQKEEMPQVQLAFPHNRSTPGPLRRHRGSQWLRLPL